MVQNIEETRLDKLRKTANLVAIEFPACCLSCRHNKSVDDGGDWCDKLQQYIDNPFTICNHHCG